eukprot:1442236-Rhodomonas_salina.1
MEAAMQAQIDSVMDDAEAVLKSLEETAVVAFKTAERSIGSLEADAGVVVQSTHSLLVQKEVLERELEEERRARLETASEMQDQIARMMDNAEAVIQAFESGASSNVSDVTADHSTALSDVELLVASLERDTSFVVHRTNDL